MLNTNLDLQQKNYNMVAEIYQLYLPVYQEVLIPADDSVRLLSQVVEGMDLNRVVSGLLFSRKKTRNQSEKSV